MSCGTAKHVSVDCVCVCVCVCVYIYISIYIYTKRSKQSSYIEASVCDKLNRIMGICQMVRFHFFSYRDVPSSRCIFKWVLEAASKRVATKRRLSLAWHSWQKLRNGKRWNIEWSRITCTRLVAWLVRIAHVWLFQCWHHEYVDNLQQTWNPEWTFVCLYLLMFNLLNWV